MQYEKMVGQLVIDENTNSAFLGIPYNSDSGDIIVTNQAISLCPIQDICNALNGKPNHESSFYIFPSKVGFVYIESRFDENVNRLLSKADVKKLYEDYQLLSDDSNLMNT